MKHKVRAESKQDILLEAARRVSESRIFTFSGKSYYPWACSCTAIHNVNQDFQLADEYAAFYGFSKIVASFQDLKQGEERQLARSLAILFYRQVLNDD